MNFQKINFQLSSSTRIIGLVLLLAFGLGFSSLRAQNRSNFQDCPFSFPVCEFKTYHFGQMKGYGVEQEKAKSVSCFDVPFVETNSFWLKWKAEGEGTLTFVINPINDEDDFDFILFKRDNKDCNKLTEVRCMAAGQNIGDTEAVLINRCKGRTGLAINSIDEFESQGCKYSSDNFLKMLQMEKDEEYILVINNYDNGEGFSITIEGEAALSKYNDCELLTISEPLMIYNLYPNPAVSSVNIEYLAQKIDVAEIDILDISGKVYQHFDIVPELGKNKNTFLLSDMAKGSYLLRIKQGKFTTVRQFVKL